MKVLFATDASPDALRAQSLIASIAWPVPSRIQVLAVAPTIDGMLDEHASRYETLYERIREGIDLELSDAQQALRAPGREIATTLLFGRPASAIVEEACRTEADVIVVGSRGRGPIATALLGSVSAEVVDHAPCPVLVARTSTLRGVVLAVDGSDCAREAEEVIATWPFLAAPAVTVVSVANLATVASMLDPFGTGAVDADAYQEMIDEMRAAHERVAREAARRLSARGLSATPLTMDGGPVSSIIDGARLAGADLIVVGTRGRTGLARLALGSVARGVLTHAPTSVLVVRGTASRRWST
ncbi:MAG: universal stress protein [Chloroflexota bacterium]|nr:universal stress protein [Chloroflexota bacterium]MDE3192294.1 universal stress protein [Chloroflexota bacterium]